MSLTARRFQPKGKKPVDRKVHPKAGRRKGEKLSHWMKQAKRK